MLTCDLCSVCSDRVQSLCYLQLARQLVSCSSDGGIAVWNMDVSREEVRSKNMAGGSGQSPSPTSQFSSLQVGSRINDPPFLTAPSVNYCLTEFF